MAYPTADEIVALSASDALLSLSPEEQQAVWARAILAVETYTGQSFAAATDKTVGVESLAGDTLYLPERLIALDSAVAYPDVPLEKDAIKITHDGARLLWLRNVVGVGYYEQALYEVSGGDYATHFPTGWVDITGTWGWEDCPLAIQGAIGWDMEESAESDANALSATVNYMRTMGIERIAQGNLDLTLSPMPTVSARVSAVLEAFVFLGAPAGRLV